MTLSNVPTGDHSISVNDAAEMTSRYRANRSTVIKETYTPSEILPTCETFNKGIFESYMENEDCRAIRIYYGMDEDLKVHAIIVGVNGDNEDMLPSASLNATDEPELFEDAVRCPPGCPPGSVLNEDE